MEILEAVPYIFIRSGENWVQTAKLTPSDREYHDYFGFSVAISGDYVVIGAYGDDINDDYNPFPDDYTGSAYVFEKPVGGWTDMTETAKLTATDRTKDDRFGMSVSISGGTIAIGASCDDGITSNSGSIYVFVKPVGGWVSMTETAKLNTQNGGPESNIYLGYSVTINSEVVVAGAPGSGIDAGDAYVFVKPVGGWTSTTTETAKLSPSEEGDS